MNLIYAGTRYKDAALTAYHTPDGDLLVVSSSEGHRTVLLVTEDSVRPLMAAEIRLMADLYGLEGLIRAPKREPVAVA